MSDVILELRDVHKHFGDFVAVERINLSVNEGEFFTLVGPSGSGKTTMIRMLVGMDKPTYGDILLRGERINDLPANQRPTCMVFQSLALFPHKSVGENIEFPLKLRGELPHDRKARALELLEQLHLSEDFYHKRIHECSGGQRQRVALARALAFDPEILFFDEPLSALDYRLRKTLEKELKDLQRRTKKTFVYITHSIEEAMVMSDRVAIMNKGRIVQLGTPESIYNTPKNSFVAQFMGEINQFKVKSSGQKLIDLHSGVSYPNPSQNYQNDQCGILVIRPENMRLLNPDETADAELTGKLINLYSLGSRTQYQVQCGDQQLIIEMLGNGIPIQQSDQIRVGWSTNDSLLLSL